ncbi:MAG: hypothetical protein AAFM92_00115 [Pseudomonadota bacterium]
MGRLLGLYLAALVTGALSGLLGMPIVDPLGQIGLARFIGLPDDALFVSLPLALGPGAVFGLIGGFFLRFILALRWRDAAVFAAFSVTGMFVASEAATWSAIAARDAGLPPFAVTYLLGSLIGSTVLLAPLAPRLGRALLRDAAIWPALWAAGIGLTLDLTGNDDLLTARWLIPLLAGWQALVLMLATRAAQAHSQ